MRFLLFIAFFILHFAASGQSSVDCKSTGSYTSVEKTVLSNTLLAADTFVMHNMHYIDLYQQKPVSPNLHLPAYTIGLFCKFENQINRNRKLQLNFGTD
ncbi:MAG: hypothetical protein ACK4IY_02625 [Chitinophagales bacterium]